MTNYGTIVDGFGSEWVRCKPDCKLEVVRPGKVQCECDECATCMYCGEDIPNTEGYEGAPMLVCLKCEARLPELPDD